MKVLRTVADMRRHLRAQRGSRAIVPTMGALHEGHIALFRAARRACQHVVASLFVNPGQFNDPADIAAYPRQETVDSETARGAGVDAIFIPTVEEMYAVGEATSLTVEGAALGFEGDFRPGHFNSVATICLKLFNIVEPDVAFFGQKDAQQAIVIRRMARDLDFPVEIEVLPTVREPDGLAMSSRNRLLSSAERARAPALHRVLAESLAAERPAAETAAALEREGFDVEYVADRDGRRLAAVRLGQVRLIDNVE